MNRINKGYLPVLALVVLSFVMIGLFTTENTELWLDGTEQGGIVAENTEINEELTTAAEDEKTEIADIEAVEGILDPSEPAVEPEDSPLSALPVIEEPQVEPEDGDALEVSLFSQKLLPPAAGQWVREFGFAFDETFGDYRFHNGRDMQLSLGDMVYACENGTVIQAEESAEWGGIVVLEGKQLTISYYGIVPSSIAVGDEIAAGELIGTAAAAYGKELAQGCHLHLAIMKNGEPQDPAEYFEE